MVLVVSMVVYVRGASVPQEPADALGVMVRDDALLVAVDACQGGTVSRVLLRKSRGVITSSDDPVIWDLSPTRSASIVTTDDPGVTAQKWPGLGVIGEDDGVTVEVTVVRDRAEAVLGVVFSGSDLRQTGTIVRGRSVSEQAFESFSARAC